MISILVYVLVTALLAYWISTPEVASSNLLIIKKTPADALEDWLRKFQWGQRSEVQEVALLPKYKFYTEVVEVLLNLARKMGGNYQEALLFLREGLHADQQFEKKLREILLGTWLQMGMIICLTWAFIGGALYMVEIKVEAFNLLMILLWQSLGLSILPIILHYSRKYYFGDIGKLWRMFYILKSLIRVPLSRTEVFTIAGVQEVKGIKQKTLSHIVGKLVEICQKSLKVGGSYEDELNYLMEELRFQEKWHFELFEKRLVVIKLGLLAIFFLPSYLAFIFLLLRDLMAMM